MKKTCLIALLALSVTWLFAGAPLSAEEKGLQAPAAEIIITGEKKSAKFSHPVHIKLELSCGTCHHDQEHQPLSDKDIAGLENGKQLRCASCHNKDFANEKLQTQKAAFHARCKDCHKEGVDGKKGPTKCTGCHVK
ncbi:MAG: cytochrome c3 family protein [Desulfobulbales bacterium]|nr:cytochrome c3 family protein [Desulfobulbales bacterium]